LEAILCIRCWTRWFWKSDQFYLRFLIIILYFETVSIDPVSSNVAGYLFIPKLSWRLIHEVKLDSERGWILLYSSINRFLLCLKWEELQVKKTKSSTRFLVVALSSNKKGPRHLFKFYFRNLNRIDSWISIELTFGFQLDKNLFHRWRRMKNDDVVLNRLGVSSRLKMYLWQKIGFVVLLKKEELKFRTIQSCSSQSNHHARSSANINSGMGTHTTGEGDGRASAGSVLC